MVLPVFVMDSSDIVDFWETKLLLMTAMEGHLHGNDEAGAKEAAERMKALVDKFVN